MPNAPIAPTAPISPLRRHVRLSLALLAGLWLAGCDQLGIESATAIAAKREADGKAVGAGCRHAARSIEQCYLANKRADRAAVFAGWREMEDYMRENKIEAVPGPAETLTAKAEGDTEAQAEAETGQDEKPAKAARPAKSEKSEKPEKVEKSAAAAKPVDKAGS